MLTLNGNLMRIGSCNKMILRTGIPGLLKLFHCQMKLFCHHSSLLKYELLNHRSLLSVTGLDAKAYLQGLITNDLGCLDKCQRGAVYSMLLNAQGRVLFDTIVYVRTSSTPAGDSNRQYLIEADASQIADLAKHLRRYRLRKRVEIVEATNHMAVAALLPVDPDATSEAGSEAHEQQLLPSLAALSGTECLVRDPRLPFGWAHRWLLRRDLLEETLKGMHAATAGAYQMARYRLGLGEGPEDHPPGKALPLECNAAILNGVSFNKGCYLGQELTARTHHTGVVRKRLAPALFSDSNADSATVAGATLIDVRYGEAVGQVRSARNGRGLAMIRLGRMLGGSQQRLLCRKQQAGNGASNGGAVICEATIFRPDWWPNDIVTAAGDSQDGPDE